MVTVQAVRDSELSESLAAEWRGLVQDSDNATPFHTPAWTTAWWRHFGRSRQTVRLEFREGDDLVGLYPLFVTSGPWRSLRAVGTGQSDYLGPLARRGYSKRVNDLAAQHVAEMEDVDLVDLHQLPEDSAPRGCLSEEQATCLCLDLPDDYERYLATLSKSLRYDCRRLDRKPFTTGEATVRIIGPDEAAWGVRVLFDLHSRRWRRRGMPGAFATRQLKDFHMDAVQALADEGQLRMGVMEFGGSAIGAIYAMQVGKVRFFYQCGFDPAQKALSPGTLLVAHSIRNAIEEGCSQFDFLRGDEPYKRRWRPQHSRRNLRYILPLNGGLGAIGKACNHAGSRVEAKIRSKLEGRGLLD